jgi:hypothetical protein
MTKNQFNPAYHSTGLSARIKAEIEASSSDRYMPSEREKLTAELNKFLAEPNEAEDSNPYMWCGGRPTRHHIRVLCRLQDHTFN